MHQPLQLSKKCGYSSLLITIIVTFVFYSLNSILLSHFILDLRSIYFRENNSIQTSHKITSLQFATDVIEGNIGASLDASWATGEERNFEEDEAIQYSNNPLVTGLLEAADDQEAERDECNASEIPVAG